MKKRLMALLLAILTLLFFVACEEEVPRADPSNPNENQSEDKTTNSQKQGAVYTDERGRKQNDLIRIEIEKESLAPPVTEISYKIYNESTCKMDIRNIYEDLEIKVDGEWVKAPGNNSNTRIHLDVWAYNHIPVYERQVNLGEKSEYRTLDAGEYRLIVTAYILYQGKEIGIQPVAEFSVVAPAE